MEFFLLQYNRALKINKMKFLLSESMENLVVKTLVSMLCNIQLNRYPYKTHIILQPGYLLTLQCIQLSSQIIPADIMQEKYYLHIQLQYCCSMKCTLATFSVKRKVKSCPFSFHGNLVNCLSEKSTSDSIYPRRFYDGLTKLGQLQTSHGSGSLNAQIWTRQNCIYLFIIYYYESCLNLSIFVSKS